MSAETDKTVDMDIDYDAEVPCDWGEIDGCTSAAAWASTSSCCALVTLHCPPHRVRFDELTIKFAGTYRCLRCRADDPDYTWRPL